MFQELGKRGPIGFPHPNSNVWIAYEKTKVSGKKLLDAVSALGLTRYSEEDMILGHKIFKKDPLRSVFARKWGEAEYEKYEFP